MKHVKFIAIVLLFAFLFVSCDTTSAEKVPEYDASVEPNDIDLMGYNYIMVGYAHGGAQGVFSLNPEPGYSLQSDKLLQRYRETEEKYNVTISHINGVNMSTFMTNYASDIKYADLMYTVVNEIIVGGYAQSGYMHAFSAMDIDLFSGIYGSESVLEAGKLGDDYYSVRPYYWGIPAADIVPAMWFNPRTFNSFMQPNPHELEEQGIWNWDSFEDICEAVRNTSDPDPSKHTYALGYTNEPFMEIGAIISNGGRWVTKNEDGRLVYALNSIEAIEAMDFVRDLAARDLIVDSGDRFNITPFIEDRAAFFVGYSHWGLSSEGTENLSYQIDDIFEWTTFPRGPRAKDGYIAVNSFWSRFFYAPSNSDISVHETLLPYLFQPLPGDTVETWQDDFERNNFFSKKSFEIFVESRDLAEFDYSTFIDYGNNVAPLLKQITRGKRSASEAFASIEDKVQNYIDTHYNDLYVK